MTPLLPRRQLSRRIERDNALYRHEYAQALAACERATLSELRARLGRITADWRLQGERGAGMEAIISTMIERGDAPALVDSTGRKWA